MLKFHMNTPYQQKESMTQEINVAQLLELSQKLIAFKSISPDQAGAIDYIGDYLSKLGFTLTRLERNGTSNLIARFGEVSPLFAFAGHIDVVPPGDLEQWDFDPYTLTSHDGCLYGRGIADMKGSVASFMLAVKEFIAHRPLINGSVMLLITSDEEAAATDGTVLMVEHLKKQGIEIDYCLIGEPTSVEKLGDVVKVGRRGSLTGHLEIIGKQGHIAYPDLCENPIHLFANTMQQLTHTQWDNGTEYFPATSFQFANLNSGLGVDNVIPGNLRASFNFRYNNLHKADSLSEKVIAILEQNKLIYNIKWKNSAKPFHTQPGRLVAIVKQSIESTLGISPQLKTDGGTSDGRFLVEICKELLEFGLSNKYIHQINENIQQSDLYDLANTYNIILNKIFND